MTAASLHALAAGEATETEDYIVAWFPPEGDREKKFGDDEAKARRHAGKEHIAKWNPLLVHRVTLTVVAEEIIPLDRPEGETH